MFNRAKHLLDSANVGEPQGSRECRVLEKNPGLERRIEPMSVSDDKSKIPVDIIVDAEGCFHALYSDGTLGPVLTIDGMMDTLPLLQEVPEAAPE